MNITTRWLKTVVCVLAVQFLAITLLAGDNAAIKTVRMGTLPYGDHTYAAIGVGLGWFKENGIDVRLENIKIDDAVSALVNDSLDAVSIPPGILFSSFENTPPIVTFVFGDLFQGFALMGGKDMISYSEFRKRGLNHSDAVRAVAAQMSGKTFAYPIEAAAKPFVDLVIKQGGVDREKLQTLVLEDALTVNAMRRNQAQFQVGGVPSRIALERSGFKPLLTSADFAKGARPSEESEELASILQNGWAVRKDYFERNHDTVIRMAEVNYRIMRMINETPKAALAIHLPYLSRAAGQSFTEEDGMVIYNSLDPFYTFSQQREWFEDQSSPFYFRYINGAIIRSFQRNGTFRSKIPSVDDVIAADEIYAELRKLRDEAAAGLARAQAFGDHQAVEQIGSLLEKFRFTDAAAVAKRVPTTK